MNTLTIQILAVGVGGAIGTLLRFFTNHFTLFTTYPLGTLIENILASFLLGCFTGWFLVRKVPDWLRVSLGVGLCGSYSTMSTFAADTLFMLQHQSPLSSLGYLALSVFGGIGFALFGYLFGQRLGERNEKKHYS
ncbi:fluoride efflux transporter FluC [Shouchella shacheensis]|uniref:fluoride efflux transporter FluC n=1 Tax=Shouchella shacheensis TaxID=1649580 RepID=UPI001FE07791|nr:CrcB family protein [Shouchella shacheensis]